MNERITAAPVLRAHIVNVCIEGGWRTYEKINNQLATFRDRRCAEVLRDTLRHNGIPAHLDILEITL